MFISLLIVTFLIAVAVSTVVVVGFRPAMNQIMERVLRDPIFSAWVRYMVFAVYVVGISAGVRIWDLEKYISPRTLSDKTVEPLVLNSERWILEVYRTIVGTLQGIAWLLLVFFIFALIGFVIVRIGEMGRGEALRKTDAERS